MELKLVNPNRLFAQLLGFNRTFMELKQNQNYHKAKRMERFNRTFMELKPASCSDRVRKQNGFNRTFMELKPEEK